MITSLGTHTTGAVRVEPPSTNVTDLSWALPNHVDFGDDTNTAPMCLEDRLCALFARILTQMQNDLLRHAEETASMRINYAKNPGGTTNEQQEILLERGRLESRGWNIRTETMDMYLAMAKTLKESADRVIESLAK